MSDYSLESHVEREIRYHVRRRVAEECRKHCPADNPMVGTITVMLGTVLSMAAFTALLGRGKPRHGR
jgi:hypothetical protein